MKKEWKKPELKIFVRGTSEETVLWACKTPSYLGTEYGPGTTDCTVFEQGYACSGNQQS
ncbi:MAG: hypothetical protein RBR08_08035 [Desulforegulaceae bacterium]|nr:hypothetical protein [Desulforegulaceae bacterium]